MPTFVVDLGNTRLKAGLFDGGLLQAMVSFSHDVLENGTERAELARFLSQGLVFAAEPGAAAISPESGAVAGEFFHVLSLISPETVLPLLLFSSVVALEPEFLDWLRNYSRLTLLEPELKLPFENLYASPLSLGSDRTAAVAGAISLYPGRDVLVINAGTAITYEFLNRTGQYLGGAISPGIQMRYKALHTFTSRLPLLELDEKTPDLIGNDTISAIRSGVQLNTLFEVSAVIGNYRKVYGEDLTICICGGDSKTFVSQLKSSIFADHLAWQPDLVLIGLNKILTFNNA